MTFVAGGNIYITGSLSSQDKAQIGLFAQGDIIIEPSSNTRDLTLENIFIIADQMMTKPGTSGFDKITIKGSLALKGQGTAEGKSAANLSSYAQRIYEPNKDCYDNPPPGMPYMADFAEWSLRGDPATSP
jgi:hypothetical protein